MYYLNKVEIVLIPAWKVIVWFRNSICKLLCSVPECFCNFIWSQSKQFKKSYCSWGIELYELYVLSIFQILTHYLIYDFKTLAPIPQAVFHSVDSFFCWLELFSLMESHVLMLVFVVCTFDVIYKKLLLRDMSRSFLPPFSSSSFTVSGLTFKSVTYFNWRNSHFPIEYSWLPCQISVYYMCMNLFPGFWFCSIGLCVYFYASIILLWLI